jgi:hypothetical protein
MAARTRDDALGELDTADIASDSSAGGFTTEPGFQWRNFNISNYTGIAAKQSDPQKAIVDWIFRRTRTDVWHGEKIAVLAASRSRLRVYNSPEILKQVAEVVERFTNATDDVLSIHIQFIAAVDTRWRYSVLSRMTPVASGPQGQQIWTMKLEESALALSTMSLQQGFRKLADQRIEMVNGQTLTVRTTDTRGYAGGIQREGVAGMGSQPKAERLEEGITLRLSPLLTFDGDALDAAIDISVNTVKAFHRTKIIAARELGPSELSVDVPEVCMTRVDQTVKSWPLGQTLVISAGIHPGILDKKSGWLGLPIPGTYPTGTEVLVFLDAETVGRSRAALPAREPDRSAPPNNRPVPPVDENIPAPTVRDRSRLDEDDEF